MGNKKSICIVSSQYFPHVGGVEQYVDNLAKELVKQGCFVTLLTSSIENADSYEKEGDFEIYRLPSLQLMGGRFPVLKYNKELRQFTKAFRKKKYDVMLVNMRFYLISLYAAGLARRMKLRCIILDHGTSHLNTGGKITTWMGELFEHGITWLEKLCCKEFAGVSGATLEWLQHFHIKSDTRLYNAVDLEKMQALRERGRRDFRQEFNIPEDALVISFVGRITVEKGIRQLVHVVNKLCETRKNIWLIAAGEGYLMDELRKDACDHVKLIGQVCMEDVVALLDTSEIFCLPSFSEGFPTCVLEASVCDNYVITTERGGAKELITGKEFGTILPDNGEEGLYEALDDVIGKPDYRKEAAKRCRERIASEYTWKHTAEKLTALIDEGKMPDR